MKMDMLWTILEMLASTVVFTAMIICLSCILIFIHDIIDKNRKKMKTGFIERIRTWSKKTSEKRRFRRESRRLRRELVREARKCLDFDISGLFDIMMCQLECMAHFFGSDYSWTESAHSDAKEMRLAMKVLDAWKDPDGYGCVYVNTRNWARFIDGTPGVDRKFFTRWPDELRLRKARNLFCLMLRYRANGWCD